jgi:hypothetical protein
MAVTVGIVGAGAGPPAWRETVESAIRSASLVGGDAEVLVVTADRDPVPGLRGIDSPLLRVHSLDRGLNRGDHGDRSDVATARNTVLARARHDVVLFTEPGCVVPAEWCPRLAAELRAPHGPVIAAPVRVDVAGPIGAYLDHVRAHEAVAAGFPALDTANMGLRRDLIPTPVEFDPCPDATTGAAGLRAGASIRWSTAVPAVLRRCREEIGEITGLPLRCARHSLHRYLRHGEVGAAMPGILDLYRQRIRDDCRIDRRFGEVVAADARTAFAVYDAMAVGSQSIGYLDALGDEFGVPLLDLDLAGLSRAWHAVGERVRDRTDRLDWASLELDYRGMAQRLGPPEPLLAEVRQALRRYAPPRATDPEGPLADVADHGLVEATTAYLDAMERIRAVYDDLRADPEAVTRDAMERAARAAGVPARVAGDTLEFSLRFDYRRLVGAWRAGGGR